MIETELKQLIVPSTLTIPAIGSRCYIGTLPDEVTYPCALLFSVSRNEMHDCSLVTERIQISCYADYLSSATAVQESITAILKRYYGLPHAASTYWIINSVFDNGVYLYDDELKKHIKIFDMMIRYRT